MENRRFSRNLQIIILIGEIYYDLLKGLDPDLASLLSLFSSAGKLNSLVASLATYLWSAPVLADNVCALLQSFSRMLQLHLECEVFLEPHGALFIRLTKELLRWNLVPKHLEELEKRINNEIRHWCASCGVKAKLKCSACRVVYFCSARCFESRPDVSLKNLCTFCKKETDQTCKSCMMTSYCNVECWQNHWISLGKHWCACCGDEAKIECPSGNGTYYCKEKCLRNHWEALGKHWCASCGKVGDKICSSCKQVYYCGSDCQMIDWQHHKSDCKG